MRAEDIMNVIKRTIALLLIISCGVLVCTPKSARSQPAAPTRRTENSALPLVDAGQGILTYAGLPTEFRGFGAYDWRSDRTGWAFHVYPSPGTYYAALRVYDTGGRAAQDAVQVIVQEGMAEQKDLPTVRLEPDQTVPAHTQDDGKADRYVVMINGAGGERRFWDDVTFMYSTLTESYHIPSERIYLFNEYGANPDGINPDGMIDYPVTLANIDIVFAELSSVIDGDDELFVWITGHGGGYYGPQEYNHGYLGTRASVDPGDEQDYLEQDFKLRSLTTGGNYALPTPNHGMNVFKVFYQCYSSSNECGMYRNKYVSTFANLYFEQHGVQSDADVYIERLVDYLLGDTDRDGLVETAQGEVFDYDGDGTPPYDHETGTFDQDDWGAWDDYEDNYNDINSLRPGDSPGASYILFDHNLDNHLDIDLNYDPNNLQVDGTDLDNEGLFDGIDVNEDGDMDDWVSVDEQVPFCTAGPDLYDDDLALLLDRIHANVISLFAEPCFSGGFIEDVSKSGRVLMTATEEETPSYGNVFVELFTSALNRATRDGAPVNADQDGNGHISMREAFNYAAQNDTTYEIPQYDDNGDGIGHPHPIPQGGDGDLGAVTYLENLYGLAAYPVTHVRSGDPGQTITYTLHVTHTGSVVDTFDIAASGHTWPTEVQSTAGPLAARASISLDIAVQVPAAAAGAASDTARVTVTSQGDRSQSITATLTTTANSVYGLTASALAEAQAGEPGQTISYTLQITNTGNVTDTFDVSISGQAWTTLAPSQAGPLAAGATAVATATAHIPPDAQDGATDTANVRITSQGDPSQWAQIALTTSVEVVEPPPVYLFVPLVSR
jgi:hypothetical protein